MSLGDQFPDRTGGIPRYRDDSGDLVSAAQDETARIIGGGGT
jgi:hypothetical protein